MGKNRQMRNSGVFIYGFNFLKNVRNKPIKIRDSTKVAIKYLRLVFSVEY